MRGRVHILRTGNHYRLVLVPSGPGRHLLEGEDALRNFLLTDLEIPLGVAEMAIAELDRTGGHTIDNIAVTDKTRRFWPLDTAPPPAIAAAVPSENQLARRHDGSGPTQGDEMGRGEAEREEASR